MKVSIPCLWWLRRLAALALPLALTLLPAPAQVADPAPAPAASAAARDGYRIGAGDVLEIDVWKEAEISRTLPVRPDGRISLPLAGVLQASGLTPAELQARISTQLAPYIAHPVVTVMVAKVGSRRYSVLGAVLRPGAYPLDSPVRVLEALAQAGGFTPFANPGGITLLRLGPGGSVHRYAFDYGAVIRGRDLDQDRELEPGDTLIVP